MQLISETAHSVLLTVSINLTVDSLVEMLYNAAQKKNSIKNAIIIYLHHISSEINIVWMKIKKNQNSSSQIIKENDLIRICAEFLVVQIIYDSYRKMTSLVSDIVNKCVRLIEHSLTT